MANKRATDQRLHISLAITQTVTLWMPKPVRCSSLAETQSISIPLKYLQTIDSLCCFSHHTSSAQVFFLAIPIHFYELCDKQ